MADPDVVAKVRAALRGRTEVRRPGTPTGFARSEIEDALDRPVTGLPARALTGAERYQRAGWLRRGARNIWTLGRYLGGADPEVLAAAYRR